MDEKSKAENEAQQEQQQPIVEVQDYIDNNRPPAGI